jgi:hypothetical protein
MFVEAIDAAISGSVNSVLWDSNGGGTTTGVITSSYRYGRVDVCGASDGVSGTRGGPLHSMKSLVSDIFISGKIYGAGPGTTTFKVQVSKDQGTTWADFSLVRNAASAALPLLGSPTAIADSALVVIRLEDLSGINAIRVVRSANTDGWHFVLTCALA